MYIYYITSQLQASLLGHENTSFVESRQSFATMSTNSTTKNRKSICETSMDILLNLIKVSTLSLADISLGTSTLGGSPPPSPSNCGDELVEKEPLIQGSQRLRKRKDNAGRSFMIPPPPIDITHVEQEVKDASPKEKQQVKDVNGMATKFIDKVHRSFKI